jgi:biopolymer transport protein ExbD
MAHSVRQTPDDETVHYISARKKAGSEKAKLEPPLTPMIDVTFQLLIYFMVTATFRVAEGQIPGSLPTWAGNQQEVVVVEDTITVRVIPRGDFNQHVQYEVQGYQGDPISHPRELYEVLTQRAKELGAETPLVIEVHPRARWQYAVEAYNQVIRAGYTNIGLRGPR